jgi:hypothetical protein
MGFTRIGYLCRHVFCVFRHHNVEHIPQQYVSKRWRQDVLPKCVFSIGKRYGIDQTPNSILRNFIVDNIQQCVDRLRSDEDRLSLLHEKVLQIKDQIFKEVPYDPAHKNKGLVIQEVNHISDPDIIEFEPPAGIRNKGCGTKKRLIGPGEKATANTNKQLRRCSYCGERVNDHDTRNCPEKKKDLEKERILEEEEDDSEEVEQDF